MSELTNTIEAPPVAERSFISHARLIGAITLVSRLVGLAREMVGTYFFGANAVWAAWKVAFTIPNLFRKLFGEGALSAAFVPLYAQALKRGDRESARRFASDSVNVLVGILVTLTIVGELILLALAWFAPLRSDHLLAVRLTMVMLPYVLLVCGTAFLSAILQVHGRFAAATATAVVLNVCLIVAIVLAARVFDLSGAAGQTSAVFWLSWAVLVSGVIQVAMLIPSLRAAGFRFSFHPYMFSPGVRRMLELTGPVAVGAGVLQLGVLLDKGIAIALAEGPGQTHVHPLGHAVRLPMAEGAAARLDLAQFMYQFPLGVFAIALATAIFPKLSEEAAVRTGGPGDAASGRTVHASDEFRAVMRRGVEASLFLGLPASAGMALVAAPSARLLFQHGRFTAEDAAWVALSTAVYSSAVWAFSLLQIVNRAYYALHDAWTPLKWVIINLILNLVIELPLLWTPLRESAMAVGTLVSFSIQAVAMLWVINRRAGGIGLRRVAPGVAKMLVATLAMTGVCLAVILSPLYPGGSGKAVWAMQVAMVVGVGAAVYFAACWAMGVRPRLRRGAPAE